jgi:hypothetical protein
MTELREDTEHAANGQFATKGGGDGLIGKSLGAKHDVLRTPEVHAQMAKMYKQAAPTMLKGTSLHQEYSFTVDKKSGKPSKIESSDESNKNHFVKPDDPVTAIVHTHPDGTLPTPGPGDPLAAVLVDAPNYELSQKELWVVQPDGTQEQVGTVEWKHGDIVITPMSGERSLPFNYSDNPNPKQPVPDSAVASGTDRSKEHEYGQDKEHKHSLWKEIQKFFRVPDDPDLDVDDNVDPDDPDDEALRENIMELFCDARSQGKTIPQEEWKRLGIGYGPVGGQQFPEACSMELMKLGPQGEPIERCIACLCGECLTHDSEFRYSEDQPRDPDGKFASGGLTASEKESSLRLWRNGAACRRIQEHVATAIKTGSDPSADSPDGKAAGILLTEIRNAPIISKDAFRGMGGATGQFDAYKDLQPGARFQTGLCSFSDDEKTARDFMDDTFHWDVAGGVKSSMMLTAQGGIKGLDVTAAAGIGGQKEILSMGTFEVVSNRGGYTKDNPGELVVRHVGVL